MSQYELALALLGLGEELEDESLTSATDPVLRSRIVELLPDRLCRGLELLSLHERPLPEQLLQDVFPTGSDGIGLGVDLGLWRRLPSGLLADPGWSHWWRQHLDVDRRRAVHRDLAQRFASQVRPSDPQAGRAGLAMVEAHRHCLSAGDVDKAHAYARYGAALLVDAARTRSIGGNYLAASQLYERVIEAGEADRFPIGGKLRAYARHYLHYNRAHGDAEGLEDTERGYRKALEDWQDNAPFWSRLARVLFYRNRPAEAVNLLREADQAVPEHPLKQNVLVARTVRGLLRHERLLDAIVAWDCYKPNVAQAREVESDLARRLEAGWTAEHLNVDPEQPLFFTRAQQVRIERLPARWIASLPALQLSATGDFPIRALSEVVTLARTQAAELTRAHTADLPPADRLRKQRLLGAIDVVASAVDAPSRETLWVFGDLHRNDDGTMWLHTGGSYDLWFEVPPEVACEVTPDELPHFARVKLEDGQLSGPVVDLEPGVRRSSDELWDEWRRRLVGAG